MTERPILFGAPMVRAILAGEKTQTRRVVKPQPPPGKSPWRCHYSHTGWSLGEDPACVDPAGCHCRPIRCPYGQPGDRLWAREAWSHSGREVESVRDARRSLDGRPVYRADQPDSDGAALWFPSIHMPREFSRITLGVTGVRTERLQAITEEDARAEGFGVVRPREAFAGLWDSINGELYPWPSNPWVFVVEFSRTEALS